MLSRHLYLPVILIVAFVPLAGCNLDFAASDLGNGALSNPDGDDGADSSQTPGSDIEGEDPDSGGQEEPDVGTGEPSDPDAEDPPDAEPGKPPKPGSEEPSDADAEDPPDVEPGKPPKPGDNALPDFSVVDVNADSARYQETVSPRDYLGQISAWYFGSAT